MSLKCAKSFFFFGFHEKSLHVNDGLERGTIYSLRELDPICDEFYYIYQGWLHRCYICKGKVIVKDLLNGSRTTFSFPEEQLKVKAVAIGWDKIYVLSTDGLCLFEDLNKSDGGTLQKIPTPENSAPAKCICAGDSKIILILEDGLVYEIIHQDDTTNLIPIKTPNPIVSVACGKEHVLLLTDCGTVLSYGVGSRGQLGHGSVEALTEPTIIEALDGIRIKHVSAGGWHSAVISNDGDAYIWGWNESCQLGFPNKACKGAEKIAITMQALPKLLEFSENVVSLSCGSRHTVALTAENKLWGWGWNGYGQLAITSEELVDKPTCLSLPTNIKSPLEIHCRHWTTIVSESFE